MRKFKRILLCILVAATLIIPTNVVWAAYTPTATCVNGTGTFTGSPITLSTGATTVTCTGAGTCTVTLPTGTTGHAISGTATIVGSPDELAAGANTVDTGVTTGTFLIVWGYPDMTALAYEARCNMRCLEIDNYWLQDDEGERVRVRYAWLYIDGQTDNLITDATLYLDTIADGVETEEILMTGHVAPFGRSIRIVLISVPPTEPAGDDRVVILQGIVKVDSDGDVQRIKGCKILGVDQNEEYNVFTFEGGMTMREMIED